tara:strand:- start:20 stop:493 length:474 start_codon:yes stop_codon:yes gene_type:complete
MKQYYQLLDALKNFLQNTPSTNTVHEGDIYKVDLSKETIFPLANIDVTNIEFEKHFNRYTVAVVVADILDNTKENEKDENNVFHGADNLQDIYNTQLSVLNLLQSSLKRGELNNDNFQLSEDFTVSATPFEQRFENLLVGWVMTLTVDVPNNDISVC